MVRAALITPKGGSGKSTAATLISHELATTHGATALFDVDPQRSSYRWATNTDLGFEVFVPEQGVSIPELAGQFEHVVVDTPGWSSTPGAYSQVPQVIPAVIDGVELVVAPIRPTWLDVEHGPDLVELVASRRGPDGLPHLHWLISQSRAGTVNQAEVRERLAGQSVFATEVPMWERLASAGGHQVDDPMVAAVFADIVAELLAFDRALDEDEEGGPYA